MASMSHCLCPALQDVTGSLISRRNTTSIGYRRLTGMTWWSCRGRICSLKVVVACMGQNRGPVNRLRLDEGTKRHSALREQYGACRISNVVGFQLLGVLQLIQSEKVLTNIWNASPARKKTTRPTIQNVLERHLMWPHVAFCSRWV